MLTVPQGMDMELRQFRSVLNISQKTAASCMEVAPSVYREWEEGTRMMKSRQYRKYLQLKEAYAL